MDFLGHCLGQGMIGLQDVNVQKMSEAPRLTTKKENKVVLGCWLGTIKILFQILLPLLPLFPILHVRVSLTGWCRVSLSNDLTIHLKHAIC